MKNYFTFEELCISGTELPIHVADKLHTQHIRVMNPIRAKLGSPITASEKSGYRSLSWELAKGRSGKSQHTFGEGIPNPDSYLGAIDWTTLDKSKLDELEKLLIDESPYLRIARYNTFIHCDYKDTHTGRRQLYKSGSNSKWEFVRFL